MTYLAVHLIHIFAVMIYGGFLFTDNLFMAKMGRSLDADESTKCREAIMEHVRKVVPKALVVAVVSGFYLFSQVFGEIGEDGLSTFQKVLLLKAFLGGWLGLRGVLQVFFKIQPLVFKSHKFPFILVIIIIFLSQVMHYVS